MYLIVCLPYRVVSKRGIIKSLFRSEYAESLRTNKLENITLYHEQMSPFLTLYISTTMACSSPMYRVGRQARCKSILNAVVVLHARALNN